MPSVLFKNKHRGTGNFEDYEPLNIVQSGPPDGYVDIGYSTHKIYAAPGSATGSATFFADTPMGGIGPTSLNNIYAAIHDSINQWVKDNGFAGSGNTNNAENVLVSKLNTTDVAAAIDAYISFMTTVTGSPYYKANYKDPNNSFFHKVGAAISHDVKEVGKVAVKVEKVVEKVVKAAVKFLKNLGEDIIFAPLLPFKPAMKNEISKAGLSTDNSMGDVIMKFFRAISQHHNFENHFEEDKGQFEGKEAFAYISLDDAVNTAQNIQNAANASVVSGQSTNNPPVDYTDTHYNDLLNTPPPPLNSVTPITVIPAPPVPQVIVSAVTAAGSIFGVPAPVSLVAAQTIWGFLHHQKQIPGSPVNKALNDIHEENHKDEHGDKFGKDDEVAGMLQIGKFKIKAAVFAPVAILILVAFIGIIVAVKHHSKKS